MRARRIRLKKALVFGATREPMANGECVVVGGFWIISQLPFGCGGSAPFGVGACDHLWSAPGFPFGSQVPGYAREYIEADATQVLFPWGGAKATKW